eukprot:GFYU01016899.1.p1 GENE.GFYU01016899.1~~GFYU01016899.1.p1  ORF type:complete len:202 (-),score=21.61 GFYU01016899.1:29-634(-)
MSQNSNNDPSKAEMLAVFDFDGTLVYTPCPTDDVLSQYEQETGHPYTISTAEEAVAAGYDKRFRRSGWWGRPETLEPPLVQSPAPAKMLNKPVADKFFERVADPKVFCIVLTGRKEKLRPHVTRILSDYGMDIVPLFLNRGNDTFTYKCDLIENYIARNSTMRELEIWEDREPHVDGFRDFGQDLVTKYSHFQETVVHHVQ